MRKLYRTLTVAVLALALTLGFAGQATAKEKFTVAWSIYVGWMPWEYAGDSGILKKWADKYGIEIELVRMDYIASVEAYVAKQADGAVMTNMECLDMPAASGIDSTALIMGDYSNGNDALLTRGGVGMKDLVGKNVNLVELSVSHYLLARALEKNGMKEEDLQIVNTSDADIGPIFLADTSQEATVTWNPIVMEIEQAPGVDKIFTSADIPGEILDMMVVRTDVLEQNPAFGKALVGAWYEVMGIMSKRGPQGKEAIEAMAESSEATATEYTNQLKTTAMFYSPQAAVDYTSSDDIKEKMDFVRQFCFSHGLLGEGVRSVDVVGIEYPDGTVQGDAKNVKMRFDTTYMQMAADGEL
ncbi:MAG: ABC transporter substrate-binding protein [bacterium]|nr:ABC transporter substrate-binding protein [bacterium]